MFTNSDISIRKSGFLWKNGSCFNIVDLVIDNSSFHAHIPTLLIYFKLGSLLKTETDLLHVLIDNVYISTKSDQKTEITQQDLLKIIWKLFNSLNEKSKIEVNNIIVNQNTDDESYIDKLDINKNKNLTICVRSDNEGKILKDLSMTMESHDNILNVYGTFDGLRLDKFIKDNRLIEDIGLRGHLSLEINQNNEVLAGKIYLLNIEQDPPTTLSNLNINLVYNNNIVDIKNCHFKVNDIYVSLIGKLNIDRSQGLLRVNISKFAAGDLCKYLPDDLVNDKLRQWYCSNINGNVLNTVINFYGNMKDITITADIEDASVSFDKDFEPVRKINGNLEFRNNDLKIIVNSAEFQGFAISGEVEMDAVDQEDAVLGIYGQAISDVYALYKTKLNKIIKIERDKISGKVKSQFSFRIFNLNTHGTTVNFVGGVHSRINDLGIYNTDIGGYELYLKLAENFVGLNGVSGDGESSFNFKEQSGNSIFKFNGILPVKIITNYIDKDYINMSGNIIVDIESLIDADNTGVINGNIDLSELTLDSSYFGWKGNLESLVFSVQLQNDNKLLLDRINIIGDNLDIDFSGKQENGNLYLSSSTFKLSDNNFNMIIESNQNQNIITIYGTTINLSDILAHVMENSNDISGDNIKVNMYVDNIVMLDDIIVHNAKFNLSCKHGDCSGSKFIGQFLRDNSNIFAEYSKIGLEGYSDNAELFLRALGVVKSIKRGKITFYLSPQMQNNKRYGMASISNFYIKDAPVLTTLLSMASFPGIVNTLNNDGIYFHRCNLPFSYSGNVIEIEKSSLIATELYINAYGTLNTASYKFQIAGEIIPFYFINKFISKVPIIGKLLTGGKSRGVIAIDYKVTGDNKSSNTSVNFITSVTPNIFKRVLGIFDKVITKMNAKYKKKHANNL